jgi:hypothetical protein
MRLERIQRLFSPCQMTEVHQARSLGASADPPSEIFVSPGRFRITYRAEYIGSRLIRMIPPPELSWDPVEAAAVYSLLAYRFPVEAEERVVRDMWHEIVEGRSLLWKGIRDDRKECIRGM